jgi:UDP-glucose 4-epimerase
MPYLVTGGGGLIGLRVVKDLASEGRQVVVYDSSLQEGLMEQLLDDQEKNLVKSEPGDVTDLPHLMRTVKENSVDTIIHLAAMVSYTSDANPPLAVKVNCEGTANVFETARILELKKVVWASSNAVLGSPKRHPEEYISNDAPHFPKNIYAATKSFNEVLASHYIDKFGVDISAIRYPFVFGIGQRWGMIVQVIRELVENPAVGKPGRVPYGDETLSWLYVNDASRATVLLSKAVRPKTKAFTISGEIRSIKEAAAYVKTLLPSADICLLPGRVNDGIASKFDMTPLKQEIGYAPKWSLEAGLRDSINIVRRQHHLCPL